MHKVLQRTFGGGDTLLILCSLLKANIIIGVWNCKQHTCILTHAGLPFFRRNNLRTLYIEKYNFPQNKVENLEIPIDIFIIPFSEAVLFIYLYMSF